MAFPGFSSENLGPDIDSNLGFEYLNEISLWCRRIQRGIMKVGSAT